MKKLLMVSAVALLILAACSEKADVVVEEVEATEVATDEGVADEVETGEATQENPVIEEKENTLVVTVNGEAKEVEALTSTIGAKEGAVAPEEKGFSVKRVEELPIRERAEGDYLFAEEGELKGTSFVVKEFPMDKMSAKGAARIEATQHVVDKLPEEMKLENYPSLQGKFDFYMQSHGSETNRYVFTKENEERAAVLTVVVEIPVEVTTEEAAALIEAMAASVEYAE